MDGLTWVCAGQSGVFTMVPSACCLMHKLLYKYCNEIWCVAVNPVAQSIVSPKFCHCRRSENLLKFQKIRPKQAPFFFFWKRECNSLAQNYSAHLFTQWLIDTGSGPGDMAINTDEASSLIGLII